MSRHNTRAVVGRQAALLAGTVTHRNTETGNSFQRERTFGLNPLSLSADQLSHTVVGFLLTFFLASLTSFHSEAQRVPCAGLVTQVNCGAFTATQPDDVVVNADMLQHDANGSTLKAIAYGRRYYPTPGGTGAVPNIGVRLKRWDGMALPSKPFPLNQSPLVKPSL